MKHTIALLALLTCLPAQAADDPKLIAVSEWSKPVESHDQLLRARLTILEGRSPAFAGSGTEVLVYVDFQNVTTAIGSPLHVNFDVPKGLKFELIDADGKAVRPTPAFGSGMALGDVLLKLPYDSVMSIRANPVGWGPVKGAALTLPMRPPQGEYWVIPAGDKGEYYLSTVLKIEPPKPDDGIERRDHFRGTIEIPKFKVYPLKSSRE